MRRPRRRCLDEPAGKAARLAGGRLRRPCGQGVVHGRVALARSVKRRTSPRLLRAAWSRSRGAPQGMTARRPRPVPPSRTRGAQEVGLGTRHACCVPHFFVPRAASIRMGLWGDAACVNYVEFLQTRYINKEFCRIAFGPWGFLWALDGRSMWPWGDVPSRDRVSCDRCQAFVFERELEYRCRAGLSRSYRCWCSVRRAPCSRLAWAIST